MTRTERIVQEIQRLTPSELAALRFGGYYSGPHIRIQNLCYVASIDLGFAIQFGAIIGVRYRL